MKITDKMRLDWLTCNSHTLEWVHRKHTGRIVQWTCIPAEFTLGLPPTSGKSPRAAIDAAIRANSNKPRRRAGKGRKS